MAHRRAGRGPHGLSARRRTRAAIVSEIEGGYRDGRCRKLGVVPIARLLSRTGDKCGPDRVRRRAVLFETRRARMRRVLSPTSGRELKAQSPENALIWNPRLDDVREQDRRCGDWAQARHHQAIDNQWATTLFPAAECGVDARARGTINLRALGNADGTITCTQPAGRHAQKLFNWTSGQSGRCLRRVSGLR